MRPSLVASVNYIARNPEPLLRFLKHNDLPIFHKSNVFFRDFQYGLWRYLELSQTKLPYAEVEQAATAIASVLKQKGVLRQINHQSFEVNMPELGVVPPAIAAAPAAKAAPAAPKTAPAAAATEGDTAAPATGGGALSATDKAAKIEELKRKMAEARARTLAGG